MKLSNEQYLLTCFAEEASEVGEEATKLVKRATKAIRFGLEEVQDGQTLTNQERIADIIKLMVTEINDMIGVAEELNIPNITDILQGIGNREQIDAKKEKIAKYMLLSKSRGIV